MADPLAQDLLPQDDLQSAQQPPQQPPQPTGADLGSQANAADQSAMSSLSGYEKQLGNLQQIGLDQANSIKQEEQQIQNTPEPQNRGILSSMPFLVALTAIGGAASGLHGRVMLGALAGMAKGAIDGNEQAFNDAQKTYQEHMQKLKDLGALQDQYYQSLYNAYGRTAEGQLQAIQMVRQITQDQLQNNIALKRLGIDEVNSHTTQLRLIAEISHQRHQEAIDQAKLMLGKQRLDLMKQQQEGQVLSPEALDSMVQNFVQTGKMPSLGMNAAQARKQFYDALGQYAEKYPGGMKAILANQSNYKALSSALSNTQKMKAMVEVNEQSAKQYAGIVLQDSKEFPRSSFPLINKAILAGNLKLISDPHAAKLANAILGFSNEYAKVITGQTSGQGVTDAGRAEAQSMLSALMSGKTIEEVLDQELRTMQFRAQSFSDEGQKLQSLLAQGGQQEEGTTGVSKSGKPIKQLPDGTWVYQ